MTSKIIILLGRRGCNHIIGYGSDSRIPFSNNEPDDRVGTDFISNNGDASNNENDNQVPNLEYVQMYKDNGRFPANLLVSDDILNNGEITESPIGITKRQPREASVFTKDNCGFKSENLTESDCGDSGSYSRYFDLDKWWEHKLKGLSGKVRLTFPFLIYPKASKSEKNKGCDELEDKPYAISNQAKAELKRNKEFDGHKYGDWNAVKYNKNIHPTVKPLKLMSYLVTLGSRKGDIVLDPFVGSGTTGVACELLNRKYIIIEREKEYIKIAEKRLIEAQRQLRFDL